MTVVTMFVRSLKDRHHRHASSRVEKNIREGVEKMPDMEKVEKLTSILEERSGLDVREAVARNIHYLDGYESYLYKNEIEYLLETLDVEEEPPF